MTFERKTFRTGFSGHEPGVSVRHFRSGAPLVSPYFDRSSEVNDENDAEVVKVTDEVRFKIDQQQ